MFGDLYSEGEGSLVKIRVRMHAVVVSFVIFFEIFLLLILGALVFYSAPIGFICMVLFILVFSYLLVFFSFWIETEKLIKILEILL
jgi:hypothetical protein